MNAFGLIFFRFLHFLFVAGLGVLNYGIAWNIFHSDKPTFLKFVGFIAFFVVGLALSANAATILKFGYTVGVKPNGN